MFHAVDVIADKINNPYFFLLSCGRNPTKDAGEMPDTFHPCLPSGCSASCDMGMDKMTTREICWDGS